MKLEIQLLSLIFSFSYGILLSYVYNIAFNLLEHKVKRYKVLINILFFVNMFLIYFFLLLKINDGVLHLYFLILLFLGFWLFVNKTKSLRKYLKVSVKK